MERLGLNPYFLRWIKSYLSDRTQHVVVDGCRSQRLPVIYRVPQRSVLGPLLFICYINDVASVISEGNDMNLFADDIALYRVIKSPADYNLLQDDVNSVSNIITAKYLHFNKIKCRTMLITRKHTKTCQPPPLLLDGTILSQVSSYKYLGITITSDLSWSPHISHICNKARIKTCWAAILIFLQALQVTYPAEIVPIIHQTPSWVLFMCGLLRSMVILILLKLYKSMLCRSVRSHGSRVMMTSLMPPLFHLSIRDGQLVALATFIKSSMG